MESALTFAVWTVSVIALMSIFRFAFRAFHSTWKLRDFKGPPASLIMGNIDRDFTSNSMVKRLRSWGNEYAPLFKIRIGILHSALLVSHPDTVKLLLMRNDPKERAYDSLEPWLGGSILVNRGKRWQRSRKLLTPTFHLDTLRSYMSIYNECARQLINRWSSENGKICEVQGDMKRLTFDVLMRCIFSIDTKCLSDEGDKHPYLHAVEELGKILAHRTTSAILSIPPVFEVVYGRKFRRYCDIVHKYSRQTIAERKAQLAREKLRLRQPDAAHDNNNDESDGQVASRRKKVDFIDVLLTSLHEDGSPVTDEEMQPEVDMFMFAGHDTTSSGLTWCLYHLASRQDIQLKCREEVYRVLGSPDRAVDVDVDVDYSDLNSLTYLTQCIKESLRMCPPVPYIGRQLVEPLELGDGRVIPSGTSVYCPITVLHYNETFWPRPEIYDPSRFDCDGSGSGSGSGSKPDARPPHAYVPFSSGPRNCIGKVFALNVMKVTLAQLVRKYEFAIDVTREVNFQHDIITRARDGIHLVIRPVSDKDN